jgi:hypothetical protein
MIFQANSLQSVAGATGVVSRAQLPATGRLAVNLLGLSGHQTLPNVGDAPRPMRSHLGQHRAQHRAQCRANCMSKANF